MSGLEDFVEECGTTDDVRASAEYEGLAWPLQKAKPTRSGCSNHEATKEREAWCKLCNRRVTILSDGDHAGHDVSCEFSIAVEGGKQ